MHFLRDSALPYPRQNKNSIIGGNDISVYTLGKFRFKLVQGVTKFTSK